MVNQFSWPFVYTLTTGGIRMIFGKKPQVAEKAAPTAATVPPTPERVAVQGNEERFEAYTALATKLGVRNGAFLREALLRFLHREEVPVYNGADVERYLDRTLPYQGEYHDQKAGWCQYPLRLEDVGKLTNHSTDRNGAIVRAQYQAAVPLPILLLVDKIATQFPDVYFTVMAPFNEDWVRSAGDPFLAVYAVGMDPLIIACWDEPGFKLNG